MSTLKADTIQSTGGGAATLTNQHAAKHWINMFGDDVSIRDSFNTSSTSDENTGKKTVNLTTSHDSANFAPVSSVGETGTSAGNRSSTTTPTDANTYLFYTSSSNSGAYNDNDFMTAATHGDLA
jgi:hypothetical protein|tara:strand:+ start:264 stop:635 length:372 start_codon:yes stop_codon:yes gene_type:complete